MVELATLYTKPYSEFKHIINSLVVDPTRNLVNSPRRWIYRDLPDTTSLSFQGYPFIVLNHSDMNDDDIILLNASMRENELMFQVEVHAEFDDPHARCDAISSNIIAAVLKKESLDAMQLVGCFSPRIVNSSTQITQNARKSIVQRDIVFSYDVDVKLCVQ